MLKCSGLLRLVQLTGAISVSTGLVLAQAQYKIIDLDADRPDTSSSAADINNRGQVVGVADGRVFIWEKGVRTYVDKPDGAAAINARGDIAGGAYLWTRNGITNLGEVRGAPAGARRMNERDQIVGRAYNEVVWVRRPFFWNAGRILDLPDPAPGYSFGVATGINNAGEAVGYVSVSWDDSWMPHAVIWRWNAQNDEVTVTDLAAQLGKNCSRAWAINNAGQVVGDFWDFAWGGFSGFLWDHGVVTAIDGLWPRAINSRGQVAGNFGGGAAAVWDPHGKNGKPETIRLFQAYSAATAINDAGDVVGWFRTTNGTFHAFVALRQ